MILFHKRVPSLSQSLVLLTIVVCKTFYLQVVWCKDLPPGRLNFFSVSEDGYVCQWILMKTEMIKVVRLTLIIDMSPEIVLFGLKEVYYGNFLFSFRYIADF